MTEEESITNIKIEALTADLNYKSHLLVNAQKQNSALLAIIAVLIIVLVARL